MSTLAEAVRAAFARPHAERIELIRILLRNLSADDARAIMQEVGGGGTAPVVEGRIELCVQMLGYQFPTFPEGTSRADINEIGIRTLLGLGGPCVEIIHAFGGMVRSINYLSGTFGVYIDGRHEEELRRQLAILADVQRSQPVTQE